MASGRTLAVVAVLVVAAGAGYWAYAEKQKREQQAAIALLLGDTTAHLRKALNAPPPPELLAKIEGNLKAAKASRDPPLESAAELYIHDAREIVRRRGDAERLARDAALNRRALAMHMGAASGRDAYWIRIAADLKKRVERDHSELEVSLKALQRLLDGLPESEKRLEAHVDASLLLEETLRRSARERAEETAKRAAEELEKTRKLGPR